MCSKSSHLLQYRVDLHDQFYRKGHSDQHKVHRLALLDGDLSMVNGAITRKDTSNGICAKDAAKGAIAAIRILNLCNKNASQAFLCDGLADPNDVNILIISGGGISKAVRDFNLHGDVKYLKHVIGSAMELLAVYVRQCWAQDVDLHKAIVEQLDEEAGDELFHTFHQTEINRLMTVAKAALS